MHISRQENYKYTHNLIPSLEDISSTYWKGLHILRQGARHLESSKEAQGTQEAHSVHGDVHDYQPQRATGMIYIQRYHTDT